MMSKKIVSWLLILVMCSLLINAGCTPTADDTEKLVVTTEEEKPEIVVEQEKPKVIEEEKPKVVEEEKPTVVEEEKPAVKLALKFASGDSTTYKCTQEARRTIKWEGPSTGDNIFKGGKTSSKIEMTFTQQIQSVDDQGNAVAQITIKGLKHASVVRDNPVLDFDSTREEDQNHALAKLTGQSYTIEITPAGLVSKIIDVNQPMAAAKGTSSASKMALALFTPEAIKERHSITAMPPTDKNQLRTGDNWSSIKSFSFGLMGSQSYDRIYTLKEVKDVGSRLVAAIQMNAETTTEKAEELHKEQTIGDFSKMFENTDTYSGQLNLDMTAGKVDMYSETLTSEWIAIEPGAGQDEEKEPAILTMIATRIYSLEKID